MRERFRTNLRWMILSLALLAVALGAVGCATAEDGELSERPWNSPKSWENGVPESMMRGR